MDAVLEKMRMPRTTTTAVVMAEPTPSCVPKKTSRQATTTFQKKEVTKTRSAKRAKERVQARDDGDGQEGREPGGYGRVEQDAQDDSDDESDDGNHEVPP